LAWQTFRRRHSLHLVHALLKAFTNFRTANNPLNPSGDRVRRYGCVFPSPPDYRCRSWANPQQRRKLRWPVFPAPMSLASIGSVCYRISVAGLVRHAGRSRLDGNLALPMENFRWKINPSGAWLGFDRIFRDRNPGNRKKCLPPPRPRGRMTLRRLGDGRPAAPRPQATAAHEQNDATEPRLRPAAWMRIPVAAG
jgi:hypothetical protein